NTAARKIESLEACRFGHPCDIGGNDTDYLQRRFGRQRFSKPFSRATCIHCDSTGHNRLDTPAPQLQMLTGITTRPFTRAVRRRLIAAGSRRTRSPRGMRSWVQSERRSRGSPKVARSLFHARLIAGWLKKARLAAQQARMQIGCWPAWISRMLG